MTYITSIDQLEGLYGQPVAPAIVKEIDHIASCYRAFIAVSPFVILSTAGPEGLDCSPRGDRPGFVRIANDRTLHMPDRRGNNRVDSLRNIVRDDRVALLFLIPGSGTTLRVNGQARLSIDPELIESFAVDGKAPRSVIEINVARVYFQCARAIMRAELWNPDAHVASATLPTPGQILAMLSENSVGGPVYDQEWPERAKRTMW